MSTDPTDEGVGYCRPPKTSQFKPGQSGNPKGRPKRPASFLSDLLAELAEEIATEEEKGGKKITRQRALIRGLVTAAIEGNTRALSLLVPILARPTEETDDAPSMSDEDRDILEAYIAREAKRRCEHEGNNEP